MNEIVIKTLTTSEIHEPARNPNVMSEDQFRMLVEAIKEVGFLQPILVRAAAPDGLGGFEIVDGVHRFRAGQEVGIEEFPCVVVDASDADATALQIGMNRLRGELDLASVATRLGELQAYGWSVDDMTLTGFSVGEVNDLLGTLAESVDDILGGSVNTGGEEASGNGSAVHVLEIPFGDKKAMALARRRLKRLGGGDLAKGLLAVLEDVV